MVRGTIWMGMAPWRMVDGNHWVWTQAGDAKIPWITGMDCSIVPWMDMDGWTWKSCGDDGRYTLTMDPDTW